MAIHQLPTVCCVTGPLKSFLGASLPKIESAEADDFSQSLALYFEAAGRWATRKPPGDTDAQRLLFRRHFRSCQVGTGIQLDHDGHVLDDIPHFTVSMDAQRLAVAGHRRMFANVSADRM